MTTDQDGRPGGLRDSWSDLRTRYVLHFQASSVNLGREQYTNNLQIALLLAWWDRTLSGLGEVLDQNEKDSSNFLKGPPKEEIGDRVKGTVRAPNSGLVF